MFKKNIPLFHLPPVSFAKQSLPPFRADKYSWYFNDYEAYSFLKCFFFFQEGNFINCFPTEFHPLAVTKIWIYSQSIWSWRFNIFKIFIS